MAYVLWYLAHMSSAVWVVLLLSRLVFPAVLSVMLFRILVLPNKKCDLYLALCERTGFSVTSFRLLELVTVMDNLCQIINESSKVGFE